MAQRWLLIVFEVPDRLGGLMSRLGLKQSRKRASSWWIIFNPTNRGAKPLAEKIRNELLALGLKGSWKQVDEADKRVRRPYHKRKTQPSSDRKVASIQAAAERRQMRDADKLLRERQRQAKQLAERDMNEHVRRVLLRAKGEM